MESNPTEAECKFIREDEVIAEFETPRTLEVERSKYDLVLECEKENYQTSRMTLDSMIEGAALGNIAAGGLIGWAVDSSTGADNQYQENVTIFLNPAVGAAYKTFLAPVVPGVWSTTDDDVKAYSERGGGGDSVAMPQAVPLTLVSKDGDWGLFEYRGEGGKPSQAWIRLDQVTKKE